MPQATFRSFMGIAKDTINANIQVSAVGGAVSLTLYNIVGASGTLTTGGATYTIFINDGVNSESKTCTGNISGTTDGSTIAVTALTNPHSANAYVYFQLTASSGPTAYIPLTKMDFGDVYDQLYDKSFYGSNVEDFTAAQGKRHGTFTVDGNLFADGFGYHLSSLMGSYDYTATAGGNPTTYAFAPNNQGNGQGARYLYYVYNPGANNFRVFAQALITDLTLKIDPGALATYTATGLTFASGVVANPGTIPPVYSAFQPVPSRVAGVTIGGTVTAKVMNAEYAWKRNQSESIMTLNGIQDPLTNWQGPLELTVKSNIVIDDDVQLLNYINESQPIWVMTVNASSGTATNGVKIQTTKSNYELVKPKWDKGYMYLEVPFRALSTTADASTAGGGRSPSLVTLSTGTTTGATLY